MSPMVDAIERAMPPWGQLVWRDNTLMITTTGHPPGRDASSILGGAAYRHENSPFCTAQ
jgi:hypothetical protein